MPSYFLFVNPFTKLHIKENFLNLFFILSKLNEGIFDKEKKESEKQYILD